MKFKCYMCGISLKGIGGYKARVGGLEVWVCANESACGRLNVELWNMVLGRNHGWDSELVEYGELLAGIKEDPDILYSL